MVNQQEGWNTEKAMVVYIDRKYDDSYHRVGVATKTGVIKGDVQNDCTIGCIVEYETDNVRSALPSSVNFENPSFCNMKVTPISGTIVVTYDFHMTKDIESSNNPVLLDLPILNTVYVSKTADFRFGEDIKLILMYLDVGEIIGESVLFVALGWIDRQNKSMRFKLNQLGKNNESYAYDVYAEYCELNNRRRTVLPTTAAKNYTSSVADSSSFRKIDSDTPGSSKSIKIPKKLSPPIDYSSGDFDMDFEKIGRHEINAYVAENNKKENEEGDEDVNSYFNLIQEKTESKKVNVADDKKKPINDSDHLKVKSKLAKDIHNALIRDAIDFKNIIPRATRTLESIGRNEGTPEPLQPKIDQPGPSNFRTRQTSPPSQSSRSVQQQELPVGTRGVKCEPGQFSAPVFENERPSSTSNRAPSAKMGPRKSNIQEKPKLEQYRPPPKNNNISWDSMLYSEPPEEFLQDEPIVEEPPSPRGSIREIEDSDDNQNAYDKSGNRTLQDERHSTRQPNQTRQEEQFPSRRYNNQPTRQSNYYGQQNAENYSRVQSQPKRSQEYQEPPRGHYQSRSPNYYDQGNGKRYYEESYNQYGNRRSNNQYFDESYDRQNTDYYPEGNDQGNHGNYGNHGSYERYPTQHQNRPFSAYVGSRQGQKSTYNQQQNWNEESYSNDGWNEQDPSGFHSNRQSNDYNDRPQSSYYDQRQQPNNEREKPSPTVEDRLRNAFKDCPKEELLDFIIGRFGKEMIEKSGILPIEAPPLPQPQTSTTGYSQGYRRVNQTRQPEFEEYPPIPKSQFVNRQYDQQEYSSQPRTAPQQGSISFFNNVSTNQQRRSRTDIEQPIRQSSQRIQQVEDPEGYQQLLSKTKASPTIPQKVEIRRSHVESEDERKKRFSEMTKPVLQQPSHLRDFRSEREIERESEPKTAVFKSESSRERLNLESLHVRPQPQNKNSDYTTVAFNNQSDLDTDEEDDYSLKNSPEQTTPTLKNTSNSHFHPINNSTQQSQPSGTFADTEGEQNKPGPSNQNYRSRPKEAVVYSETSSNDSDEDDLTATFKPRKKNRK